MANLLTKIKLYVNKDVNFFEDIVLQNDSDGKGTYIKEWNIDVPKPTLEQLESFEEQANIYEANLVTENENKEINKQSALNKLKALGLNDAEIKSIIGI